MGFVYVIGTFDTKSAELHYAADRARAAGAAVIRVDVSTKASTEHGAEFSSTEVAAFHPGGSDAVFGHTDRGAAVSAMAMALTKFLLSRDDISAVLGMGGTGNTALVTEALRALPIGVPKLMVSTVASGNTAPYVGSSDLAMMYSVVDVAGLNPISAKVISNAAHAAAGMATNQAPQHTGAGPSVGMTMFGVTTACVTQVREKLGTAHECYVFHATGVGGRTMEKLVDSGLLEGVIDVTTTEVADLVAGGVFAATEDRFGAVIRTSTPYVGSLGALDMVNFGAANTVPARYADRQFHVHNAQITLMRTTAAENAEIGRFIVARLNQMKGPVRFLMPLAGLSAIDAVGQPFFDPVANKALFDEIRRGWVDAPNRQLIELDLHINDPAFADAVVDAFYSVRG